MDQPPRAYAVDQPGFDWSVAVRLEILLNGVVVDDVISYDCDEGTVLKYVKDDDGYIKLNATRDDAATELLTGNVEVRFKSDDAPHERAGKNNPLPG